ncbi:hypothetical protein [Arthrobacter pigmenti]
MARAVNNSGSGQQWSVVRPGDRVVFEHDSAAPIAGVVDVCTEDASVVWVHTVDGTGRLLIHRDDGYRLAALAG